MDQVIQDKRHRYAMECLCQMLGPNLFTDLFKVLSVCSEDMTRGAYEFCGADPDDDVDGDGMTPLFSAIAFEAADSSSARSTS